MNELPDWWELGQKFNVCGTTRIQSYLGYRRVKEVEVEEAYRRRFRWIELYRLMPFRTEWPCTSSSTSKESERGFVAKKIIKLVPIRALTWVARSILVDIF